MAKFEFTLSFGGASDPMAALRFGTTYAVEEFVDVEQATAFLPVTGLGYSTDSGVAPLVLGLSPAAGRGVESSDQGISWGWWAAGAGAAIALAVAAGSGDEKKTVDGEDNNETECGVGGGGLIPDIDLNCLP